MMQAVEMYIIIGATLMTASLGLAHNCLHYCNDSSEHSSIPSECNCQNQLPASNPHIAVPAEDTGIYYEPVKQNSYQESSSKDHILRLFKNKVCKLAVQDEYVENHSTTKNKFKRTNGNFSKLKDDGNELPLNLYLDLDIDTSKNNNISQIEELKKMIENFQAIEKDLSECINLHIYIFSKYVDTNIKTNTNWGQNDKNDNLSNSQELIEIQSKCEQPVSIIKQSIYQIQQVFSQEEPASEIFQDEEDIIKSNTGSASTTTYAPGCNNHESAKTGTTTVTTHPTDDVPAPIDRYNFIKNDDDFAPTSSSLNDNNDFKSTTIPERTLLMEEEMIIPRILTKELTNGSVTSVVDGYEEIPNSDFITNVVTSTVSNDAVGMSSSNEIEEPDLVEIHGSLYFSFGKEHNIPARFIQHLNGSLNVAIDGFSMCNHMLQVNTSHFMNMLCKCINLKHCT